MLKNTEIEKYIIGSLVIEKSCEVYKLEESDFFHEEFRLLFKVIKYLVDKSSIVDIISVADLAQKRIDNAYELVSSCCNVVATVQHFDKNLEKLKVYSLKRTLLKQAEEIKRLANDTEFETSEEIKAEALQKIADIKASEDSGNMVSLKDLVMSTIENIEREYGNKEDAQMLTGLRRLDNLMAGFHKQELTILAARPGIGKTAFALNLLLRLAERGANCLFVSREMSDIQLCKRIISNYSGVDGNKIRQAKYLSDDNWEKIGRAAQQLFELRGDVYVDDKIINIEQVRLAVRRLKNQNKIDVLFVDYLGLVKTSKKCESHRLEIEHVSWTLKQISKEFDIPVICLCQLNRASETGNDEPQLHHLRESGAIEQDADNVMMLHVEKEQKEEPFQEVQVLIRKQRNGPTGKITLKCYTNNFKYFDD